MKTPHPLGGAYARIDRADKHFKELESFIEAFGQTKKDEFFGERYPKPQSVSRHSTYESKISSPNLRVPLNVAIILSDVVHNLRSALDYLIYELACEDEPGVVHENTQFIITDSKADTVDKSGKRIKGFDSSKWRLNGLSATHIDAIENLQPYKGCAWTKTLRDISNPDKHRKLTAIGGRREAFHTIKGGPPGSFKGDSGEVFPGHGIEGADVYVERYHAIEVELPDETPILKTLEVLKGKVRATIDAFKPEFKR